jgi:hypothetical protein
MTHYIWGERRGPTRRGAVGGTTAAVECPLQTACKGRRLPRGTVAVSLRNQCDNIFTSFYRVL